jgi:hypothetical protein
LDGTLPIMVRSSAIVEAASLLKLETLLTHVHHTNYPSPLEAPFDPLAPRRRLSHSHSAWPAKTPCKSWQPPLGSPNSVAGAKFRGR